jgi:hypothetical protein
MVEQIDRDLERTHPDKKFFAGETSFSRKNRVLHCLIPTLSLLFTCLCDFLMLNDTPRLDDMLIFHLQEAMKNILLLFAKLNPAIRYVQGMNEVLAPIYYVFSTDPNEKNAVRLPVDFLSLLIYLLIYLILVVFGMRVWGPKVIVLWVASLADF